VFFLGKSLIRQNLVFHNFFFVPWSIRVRENWWFPNWICFR